MSRRCDSNRAAIFHPNPDHVVRLLAFSVLALALSGQARGQSSDAISREVREIFERCSRSVVKIHGQDQHSDLSGTGFFIDPTGTIYTAYSVAGEATNFSVEFSGKKYPAHQLVADLRSGIAMLKIDAPSPALPIGKSEQLSVAAPIVMIGYPLDLPETPSFGMIGGFDRKYLDRYLTTTHLRANLPTQRGEAGAPLLNMNGEVVGVVVSSLENSSSCYALPIEAAEKIRSDFVRFGQVRHGWIGGHLTEAAEEINGSRAEMTEVLENTPAANCGLQAGDILLRVGRKEIHQPDDIIDASFFLTAGDSVPITVMRGGEKLTFNVLAEDHPIAKAQHLQMLASPGSNQALMLDLQKPPENTP